MLAAVHKNIPLIFLLLIFIFSGINIYAQNNSGIISDTQGAAGTAESSGDEPIEVETSSILSSEAGSNVKFVQRLTWDVARYAVRYSVLLEHRSEELDIWTEVLRRNMDAEITYVDVSVPAGEYRYRVYSFNILGQLDTQTDWEYFTVLKAIQPSILTFTPSSFFFDRSTSRIINLTGEGLFPDTEFFLEGLNLFDENNEPLVIIPVELHLNELGETARLIFEEESLVVGKYNIVAKSAGGLESRQGVFSIAVAKPFDINVSGGYTPNLTLYGIREHFLDKVFVAGSMAARVNYIPLKRKFGYIGAEITPGYTILTSEKDNKKSIAHMLLVNIDGLYQYPVIRQKLFINARAGLGIAGIFDFHFKYIDTGMKTSKSMSTAAFSLNLGASVQWFFHKQFFMEGGLDYIHVFLSEIPMGFIRLGIYGGYQF